MISVKRGRDDYGRAIPVEREQWMMMVMTPLRRSKLTAEVHLLIEACHMECAAQFFNSSHYHVIITHTEQAAEQQSVLYDSRQYEQRQCGASMK